MLKNASGQLRLIRPPNFSLELTVMCGRYRLSRRNEILSQYFGADFSDLDWEPRYNIAPTQMVPVVRRDQHGTLRALLMRWG
jgi:putative SOS response-associated peptidase YedK